MKTTKRGRKNRSISFKATVREETERPPTSNRNEILTTVEQIERSEPFLKLESSIGGAGALLTLLADQNTQLRKELGTNNDDSGLSYLAQNTSKLMKEDLRFAVDSWMAGLKAQLAMPASRRSREVAS